MKVKRSLLFGLVVFASVVLAAGPVMAAIANLAITAPTTAAKAYIRTNGNEAARTVTVNYTFTADKTNQDVRWDVYIAPGTAYAVYVRNVMLGPISLTPYNETKTRAAMATTPEGLYDVRVRVSQPALGNWTAFEHSAVVVTRTEEDAVMVDNTKPTSAITSPADGATLTVNVLVTITGTASDPVSGGVASGVASVAVTVSDGITTTPLTVTGTTSWSAPWTPTAVGIYTITSVATDRSGNVQNPGTSITVYVGEPTDGSPAAPAAPAVANALLNGIGFTGKRGPIISAVAHHMGPGTAFDGVLKSNVAAYEAAVKAFLNTEFGLSIP